MPPKQTKSLCKYLNFDSSPERLEANEAMYIKNYTFDQNANGKLNTGTGNPSGEGQNEYVLTPVRSNKKLPKAIAPKGYNKTFTFESINTKELYYFVYNSKGKHSIFVVSGDDNSWTKIIEDSKLNFSDDPSAFISEHRVRLRVEYDADKNIIEKYLIWTDGKNWHGYLAVVASTKTNGFNPVNPYWQLKQPHYDRNELFEYAVRPPMYEPTFVLLDNTDAQAGVSNKIINTGFQFCTQFINTDGRETNISPLSLPLIVKTKDFLSDPDLIQKRALLTLPAGSPLTERVNLYYRYTVVKKDQYGAAFITWSNWLLYDTITKYTNCGENDRDIIGTDYWLRKNPFADNNFNSIYNTIEYVFDNTRLGQIVPQEPGDLLKQAETGMPQLSVALSDLGDAIALANNRYGYNNFNCNILDKLSASYRNKELQFCARATRKITVYAYLGARMSADYYYSNVGYHWDTDTQMRFGGISIGYGDPNVVNIDLNESKTFGLDFADRGGLIAYAKGTPYYATGTWYQVNLGHSKVKIETPLDGNNADDRQYIYDVYAAGGFFVCQFEIFAPAGRYDIALGRHNVPTNEDWRSTSTYVMGIADSLVRSQVSGTIYTVKPNAIFTYSKEMEIDCTLADVDTWSTSASKNVFYVYVPSINSVSGHNNWKFVEGYFYDEPNEGNAMELFNYTLINGDGVDDSGIFTDKNGFYFAYSKHNNAPHANVQFNYTYNCGLRNSFTIAAPQTTGYFKLGNAYFSNHNGGEVGFQNYVVLKMTVRSLDGTTPYSNISVTIVDGATAYTNSSGEAILKIHNGYSAPRISNVYVNAGGNFIVSIADCGILSLYQYDENNVVCQDQHERVYPPILEGLLISVENTEQTSVKSNATYLISGVAADLAGRRTFANTFAKVQIPSYVQIDKVDAFILTWAMSSGLSFQSYEDMKDMRWFSFFVTKAIDYQKYLQWVGDTIDFIDINNNVTTDFRSAALVRIKITSLLQANIKQNFTFLANYQFVQGDRLRIFDDGQNNLFDTATYGSLLDVEIQGQSYNQAAVNANLLPPANGLVLNQADATTTDVYVYAKYDTRFDKLKDKTGFWIELFTTAETTDITPFYQCGGWMPIIGGDVATFDGLDLNGDPQYLFPRSGDITFWDTYLINRIITSVTGSSGLFHPFESPNVTDTWGANLISGGNATTVDVYAKQMWYLTSIAKSDNYIQNGSKNGLATFREANKRSFEGYWWGGIVMMKAVNSYIFYLCQNDYFTTDYNYHYAYINAQGVMVANLNNGISEPHQKIDEMFGCNYEDTSSIISTDILIGWHDQKNSCYVLSDYRTARDITMLQEGDRRVGIKSYYSAKTNYIGQWNNSHDNDKRYDIVVGLDMQVNNLYVTFRPRRSNSIDVLSFISNKRNIQTNFQETFVYSLDIKRWTRLVGFAPESYGKVRGALGNEMFSFVNGLPYYHLNTGNESFCEFYGVATERIIMPVLNDDIEVEKVLQSISLDSNNMQMFCDLIYSNQPNSFSYIPSNYWKKKGNMWYAPILRDANSFPNVNETFRNNLFDGKRMFGVYTIIRLIGDLERMNDYQELNNIFFKYLPLPQSFKK